MARAKKAVLLLIPTQETCLAGRKKRARDRERARRGDCDSRKGSARREIAPFSDGSLAIYFTTAALTTRARSGCNCWGTRRRKEEATTCADSPCSFFLLLKTTCADSPRSSAPFLVEQLRNRTSCTPSVTAWLRRRVGGWRLFSSLSSQQMPDTAIRSSPLRAFSILVYSCGH